MFVYICSSYIFWCMCVWKCNNPAQPISATLHWNTWVRHVNVWVIAHLKGRKLGSQCMCMCGFSAVPCFERLSLAGREQQRLFYGIIHLQACTIRIHSDKKACENSLSTRSLFLSVIRSQQNFQLSWMQNLYSNRKKRSTQRWIGILLYFSVLIQKCKIKLSEKKRFAKKEDITVRCTIMPFCFFCVCFSTQKTMNEVCMLNIYVSFLDSQQNPGFLDSKAMTTSVLLARR